MKIHYIANVRIPTEKAHGLQIMEMCRAFAAAGAEVELILPKRFNAIKADAFDYYGLKRDFKLAKLPCLDLFAYDRLLGNLALWLETYTFCLSLKKYLPASADGVIYTRDEFLLGLLKPARKVILEIHNLPEKIRPRHLRVWRRAEKIVVITSILKDKLIEQGIAAEKIIIAADAVNLAEFDVDISQAEARKRLVLPPDKKIILYTGSFYLYDWKGVDVLLASLPLLPQNALLVLVGGKDKEIEKIKRDFTADNLLLIAARPHQDMPYFLKAADVLALPNKKGTQASESYTSPLKLFEYMASRRPIVASDLPSLRDVLSDKNAVLIEPNDPAALAAGVKAVLTDAAMAEKLASQAFTDVQDRTWDKRAKKIIDFINK